MAMLSVASLVKHLDEIRLILLDKKLDVLAINETRFCYLTLSLCI